MEVQVQGHRSLCSAPRLAPGSTVTQGNRDLVRISDATISDWLFLHRHMPVLFPEICSATLGHILRNELPMLLLARNGGVPAGFCHMRVLEQDAVLWVNYIGVLPEYRRRGMAEALLDEVVRRAPLFGCTAVELDVVVRNAGAVSFYEQTGFQRGAVLQDDKGRTKYRYRKALLTDTSVPCRAPDMPPKWQRLAARLLYVVWLRDFGLQGPQ